MFTQDLDLPLHLAAQHDNLKCAEILISHGAGINKVNDVSKCNIIFFPR